MSFHLISIVAVCQVLAICLASSNSGAPVTVNVSSDGHTVTAQVNDTQNDTVSQDNKKNKKKSDSFMNMLTSLLQQEDIPDYVKQKAQRVDDFITQQMIKAAQGGEPMKDWQPSQEMKDDILEVIRSANIYLSPEESAEHGFVLTAEDLAFLNGERLEEAKKNAYEGDIVMDDDDQQNLFLQLGQKSPQGRAPSYGAGKPWQDATMKYCYAPDIKPAAKEAAEYAVTQIEKTTTCVKFRNVGYDSGTKCKSSPAVYITSEKSGCWSYVGERTKKASQQLNLQSPGCDTVGVAMHEILHALGMAHEQARPDRDEYVEILKDNIKPGFKNQFNIERKGDTSRPYDILSVMHYAIRTFSIDGELPTIRVKPKGYALYTKNSSDFQKYVAGNRIGMTQRDADQLADLYSSSAPDGFCTSNIYVSTGKKSCSRTSSKMSSASPPAS